MTIEKMETTCVFEGGTGALEVDVPFPMAEDSLLAVRVTDNHGDAVDYREGVDYTVGKGVKALAPHDRLVRRQPIRLTLAKPLPGGWTMTLARESPISQTTQFYRGFFDPTETSVDKLTMICQELDDGMAGLRAAAGDASGRLEALAADVQALDLEAREQKEEKKELEREFRREAARLDGALAVAAESVLSVEAVLAADIRDLAESVEILNGKERETAAILESAASALEILENLLDEKMPVAPDSGRWLASGSGWVELEDGAAVPEPEMEDETMHMPTYYNRSGKWSAQASELVQPDSIYVDVGGTLLHLDNQPVRVNCDAAASWDNPDWAVPASRAGGDFYIYAVKLPDRAYPQYKLSKNATCPEGVLYDQFNTRRIGGFHCLCRDVGVISGHALSGMTAGQILPASVWDLRHRPLSDPEGMVYCAELGKWYQIYLCDTDFNSTFEGVIATSETAGSAYGFSRTSVMGLNEALPEKRLSLFTRAEFMFISRGSNEGTNINGGVNPGTAGGHVDTNGRRMVSDIGIEDACGVMEQWISENADFYDASISATTPWAASGGKGKMQGAHKTPFVGGRYSSGDTAGRYSMGISHGRIYGYAYIGCRACSLPMSSF